jgi:hypothetical protein
LGRSISGVVAVVIALLVWAPWNDKPDTNGEPKASNQVEISKNNGQVVVGGGDINNFGPTANNDPRAQIVQLTGSWSEQGFVNAIVDRDTSIVDLYLKSGMKATTLQNGASAILYGFQGVPRNGDPVELVKTFQAAGFKVDDELQDNSLMDKLSVQGPRSWLPIPFNSPLAPKGYVGWVRRQICRVVVVLDCSTVDLGWDRRGQPGDEVPDRPRCGLQGSAGLPRPTENGRHTAIPADEELRQVISLVRSSPVRVAMAALIAPPLRRTWMSLPIRAAACRYRRTHLFDALLVGAGRTLTTLPHWSTWGRRPSHRPRRRHDRRDNINDRELRLQR